VAQQISQELIRGEVSDQLIDYVLHAPNENFPLKQELGLCHVFAFNLLSDVAQVSDVHTILMEELTERMRVCRNVLSLGKALDQIGHSSFLHETGEPFNLLFLLLDLLLGHGKLGVLEYIRVEYFLVKVLDEGLEVLLPALIELNDQLLILLLLLISHLLPLFHLR